MRRGHSVEWFGAAYPGSVPDEWIEGIHVVRAGRQWTVHFAAIGRYRKRASLDFDVIVDETNTIPFFASMWADVPAVVFIHQLAREVWWYEAPFPLSLVGYLC